jgi:hypothetical protein
MQEMLLSLQIERRYEAADFTMLNRVYAHRITDSPQRHIYFGKPVWTLLRKPRCLQEWCAGLSIRR